MASPMFLVRSQDIENSLVKFNHNEIKGLTNGGAKVGPRLEKSGGVTGVLPVVWSFRPLSLHGC